MYRGGEGHRSVLWVKGEGWVDGGYAHKGCGRCDQGLRHLDVAIIIDASG